MSDPSNGKVLSALRGMIKFISSFGLAATLFTLLAILVLFATLAQVNIGIHDVKQDYFSSSFVVHRFFAEGADGVPVPSRWGIPLIGGYPLMGLLFFNILVGGLIRIRKRPQTVGVVISHFSMLILLAWGFVTNHFVDEGYMQIHEGDEVDYFVDYTKWDMELIKESGAGARETVYLLPHERLVDLEGEGSRRVFENTAWPFAISVTRYARNSVVEVVKPWHANIPVIDGYVLDRLEPKMEAEANIPGGYVDIKSKGGQGLGKGIVWGYARQPLTITDLEGDKWSLKMRKRIYHLPYSIKLRKFIKEDHPGVSMAKRYMSDVTKIEEGLEEDVRIRMNHPLNSGEYTFYQASFGPNEGDPAGTPVYTVLAVWKRPLMAGQWPLVACIAVAVGLLVHFIMKLTAYFKREGRRGAQKVSMEDVNAQGG
ncbi:MAG: cytochrome c biogenesis protein ResB [Verrucomicrobiales bacterium]